MGSFAYVLVLLLLSGCGGFRGGIESVPYVDENKPHQISAQRSWLHEIILPGFTVHLSLNNTVRTYQYEVMLYIIPTYVNLWDEFQHQDAEALELTLQITAHDLDLTIDARQLILTLDDKKFRPTAVWVHNQERERRVIEAYVKARHQSPADHPLPIPHSSEWRDAVMAPVTVRRGEESPRFLVTFPVPLPSPERTLSLDLTPASAESPRSGFPLIRFKLMRWSEGYS
jgi:hypothetical protein